MDFRFTEEQDMIAETVQDALRDLCSTAQLRAMHKAGQTYDADRWAALADLGLNGILLPEAQGGLALDEVTMCRVAQACGAALLPEPLVDHAGVALPLLAELARSCAAPDLLQPVSDMAQGDGHTVLFSPVQPFAVAADTARIVIHAPTQGQISIGPAETFDLTAQPTADPLTLLHSCQVTGGSRRLAASPRTEAALARANARGALFAAAQLLGVAQAALDLAVDYAGDRQQFGRPIGSNQAVKHMLAEVQVQVAFLKPVVYAAAALISREDDFSRGQISHAWLRAIDVADRATRVAVQVHGAMGYSWETDVHLYLKRALVLSGQWGTRFCHGQQFDKRIATGGFIAPLQ
ncbi:acyl-CoA dehydrogenase family protein [Ponticoccus sp. (in: a-proteobacteria)]|uniref:acyl-CoA dehydrogenase family protein n=1 Tax=Ponticoccus sp. (in: a-proteobacteria) TaxID=1925025 RepID=UPI003AB19DDA